MLEFFYNLSAFFIIFTLYELVNFNETKQYVIDMHTPSDIDYVPKSWSGRFFIDFVIFLWLLVGIILNLIFNDNTVSLFLIIVAVSITQFVMFALMNYNDKKYIIWYYVFNIVYCIMFIIIFVTKQSIF